MIVCKSQGTLTRWRSNKYATQSTDRRFDRYELKCSRCLLATISILSYDNGARPVRFLSACTTGLVTSSCAVITYARRFQQIYAYYSRSSRPMFIKTLENPLWVRLIVIFPSVLPLLSFQSAVTFGQLKNRRGRIVSYCWWIWGKCNIVLQPISRAQIIFLRETCKVYLYHGYIT